MVNCLPMQTIIKDACMGYDLKELGLDFDIDATYL